MSLQKALEIAEQYHKGQMRKSGEPYLNHPKRVMALLQKHNFPEEALISALLHDVCEDTTITNIEISQLF